MRPFVALAASMSCISLGSTAIHGASDGPATANTSPRSVVLVAYDTFGVRSAELAAARAAVEAILRLASLQAAWHTCPKTDVLANAANPVCTTGLTNGGVAIRIVAATPAVPIGSLGSSLVERERGGVLATVFADRVHTLASLAGVEPGILLGRVIAHEVGHLLTKSPAHTPAGLMRARWTIGELRRDLPDDWTWSRQDVAAIARGTTRPPTAPLHRPDTIVRNPANCYVTGSAVGC